MNTNHGRRAGSDALRGRRLHIVDIENLAGCGAPSLDETRRALLDYGLASGRRQGDQVWVCCSSAKTLANLALAMSGGGLACLRGADGAERAIDERLDWARVARQFGFVTIGSGDHYFAPRMALLAAMDVEVTCIAREGSVSAASRLASHRTILLPRVVRSLPATGGFNVVA